MMVEGVLLSVFVAGFSVSGSALQSPCDPELAKQAQGPHAYRVRDGRCEGIYAKPVAGTTLSLISLTESFEEYDPLLDRPLTVSWSTPGADTVRLRAESLERDLHYRMDAIRPGSAGSFAWQTGVLGAQKIMRAAIGVLGWTKSHLGGVEHEVYLPLRISQQQQVASCARYDVVLWPGVRLTEVYVSIAPVNPSGSIGVSIRTNQPLKYGYYPSEQPIPVQLSGFPSPGIYYVKIAADLHEGGTRTIEYWMYHSHRPAPGCPTQG